MNELFGRMISPPKTMLNPGETWKTERNILRLSIMRFGLLAVGMILPLLVGSCSKRAANASDIVFGTNLGPLRFNMTKAQIQDVLGSASFQRANVLNYNEMGLTIVLNRKGRIGSIICGSMDADANLLSNFKGTSKEGITLGALSADVVRTYGQPTEIRDGGIGKIYRYETLSAEFAFKDDRVICIVLRPTSTGQTSEP